MTNLEELEQGLSIVNKAIEVQKKLNKNIEEELKIREELIKKCKRLNNL